MPWIESHTTSKRNRKIKALARILNIPVEHALGCIHSLWHETLEQQEDGCLASWDPVMIAEGFGFWIDKPEELVSALQRVRLMDGNLIHDWIEYAGRYLDAKYRSSDIDRLIEIWKLHGLDYSKKPGRAMASGWQRTRRAIMRRDGHKCRACAGTEDIEVHHLISRKDGGTDKQENLVVLCRNCHRAGAHKKIKTGSLTTDRPSAYLPDRTLPTKPTEPTLKEGQVDGMGEIRRLTGSLGVKSREQVEYEQGLLKKRMPFGDYKGVAIQNLDHEYARWLISEFEGKRNIKGWLRDALKLRIQIKEAESNG